MGFSAFGAGFFKGATDLQESNRDEARVRRRDAMRLWETDTLPQVRKAQAADTKRMTMFNQLSSMKEFEGREMQAWHASGVVGQGLAFQTADAYLNNYNLVGAAALPPEVQAEQRRLAEEQFDFDVDEATGRASNFSYKPTNPQANAQPQLPGSRQNKLSKALFGDRTGSAGRRDDARDFERQTGVNPLNAQTTARSASIAGTVPTSVDRKQEDAKALITAAVDTNFFDAAAAQGGDTYEKIQADLSNGMPLAEIRKKWSAQVIVPEEEAVAKSMREQFTISLGTEIQKNTGLLTPEGLDRYNAWVQDGSKDPVVFFSNLQATGMRSLDEMAKVSADAAFLQKNIEGRTQSEWAGLVHDPVRFKDATPHLTDEQRKVMYAALVEQIQKPSQLEKLLAARDGQPVSSAPPTTPPPVSGAEDVKTPARPGQSIVDDMEQDFTASDGTIRNRVWGANTPYGKEVERLDDLLGSVGSGDDAANQDILTAIGLQDPIAVARAYNNKVARDKDEYTPEARVETIMAMRFTQEDWKRVGTGKANEYFRGLGIGELDALQFESVASAQKELPPGVPYMVKGDPKIHLSGYYDATQQPAGTFEGGTLLSAGE
jgi:hypothetical protein